MLRRETRVRLGLVAAFFVAVPLGCSLFADLDGLASEDRASEAGPREAGNDDAPAPVPELDAGKCEASFCDDFDTPPLGGTWSKLVTDPTMSLGFGIPFLSSPNAMRARVVDAGTLALGVRGAWLERDLGRGTRVRCSFGVNVIARTNDRFMDIFQINTSSAEVPDYDMWLQMDEDALAAVREDISYPDGGCGCPRKSTPLALPALGTWTSVTVETDFKTLRITYDGNEVLNDAFGGFVPTGPVRVGLGVRAYGRNDTASHALFDDFTCTLAP